MDVMRLLSLAFLGWLLGCNGIRTINSPDRELSSLWDPVLSHLNREHRSPFEIKTDLLLQNQKELDQIRLRWSQTSGAHLSKVDRLKQQNEYFNQEIKELNKRTFLRLRKREKWYEKSNKNYRDIADKIIKIVESNPISSSKHVHDYEHGGQLGFCFGRALLVHYLLITAGVPRQDILKIFTIGELWVEKQLWHFHVAVMVRDSSSGFIVVDSLQEGPLAYQEWLVRMQGYDVKYPYSRLRFYLSDPRKFLPGSGIYELRSLSQPGLKNYFYKLGLEIPALADQVNNKASASSTSQAQ